MNKLVKKAIRRDIRAYNTLEIQKTIEDNMNMKVLQSRRSRGKGVIHKMRNEQGEVEMEREKIGKVIENFYRRLYSQTNPSAGKGDVQRRTVLNVGSEELMIIDGSRIGGSIEANEEL